MDKILVTLLLIILSVVAIASMGSWFQDEVDQVQITADQAIEDAKPQ